MLTRLSLTNSGTRSTGTPIHKARYTWMPRMTRLHWIGKTPRVPSLSIDRDTTDEDLSDYRSHAVRHRRMGFSANCDHSSLDSGTPSGFGDTIRNSPGQLAPWRPAPPSVGPGSCVWCPRITSAESARKDVPGKDR